ncbi:hypothetical protein VPH35_104931 [Triticum aestivum]
MASLDAPDAAIAIAAPIPPWPCYGPSSRTDSHEQFGVKEADSVAHVLDGINSRPDRTDRTPAWESEKLYGTGCLTVFLSTFLPDMFSRFPSDAFMSYGTGA